MNGAGGVRSFRLKLDTGIWNDFEAGEGGGVLTLVMRENALIRRVLSSGLSSKVF